MHFDLGQEQLDLRDSVRSVLAKECTTADLRAAYDAPSWATPRWTTLAELGVLGMALPESRGGLGLGMVDLAVVLEEAGRVALPEPLAATAAVAGPLLSEVEATSSATDGRIAGWLGAIAAGGAAAAVGAGAAPEPVAGADGAPLLVLASPIDAPAPALFVVDPEEDGPDVVRIEPLASLDPTRRLARVPLGPAARPITTGEEARPLIDRLRRRAVVATAAELLGLADRLVTMSADYACHRTQFGRPIGSFQAVKHLLAGAQVQLEFARPAVYAAAWAIDEDEPDAERRASAAKAQASEAALEAARVGLQVHGAIGYTWECDLQLFLKRAWALAAAWGAAAEHRRRVLDSLVAERARPDRSAGAPRQGTAKA